MAAMMDDDLHRLLQEYGITVLRDQDGARSLSIDVVEDIPGSSPRKAYFKSEHQRWRLGAASMSYDLQLPSTSSLSQEHVELDKHQWWTTLLPDTNHTKLLVSADWSQTSLGPISMWSSSLKSYTSMCLSESLATVLFWGPERVAIYNEAAIPLLGDRHPSLMAGRVSDRWPEVKDVFKPYFQQLEQTGTGKMLHDFTIPLDRQDFIEETWWNADLLPLREDDGSVGGFCFTWIEITRQVISDRFSRIANEVGNTVDHSDQDVWQHINTVLKSYSDDVTMGVLYSASSLDNVCHKLKLEATLGIKIDQTTIPFTLDLESDSRGFTPLLRRVFENQDDFLIQPTALESLSQEILESIEWQGYGEQSKNIAIIPILVFNNLLKGFVIIGLNPRVPMNTLHQQFLSDLSRQLKALFTTVTNAEQAKRRETKLIEDLAMTEKRIRRMAELAPMGMYDLSAEGKLLWANTHFFDILGAVGQSRNFKNFSWLDFIHPDDHEAANIKMARSIIEHVNISDSLRLQKTWIPPNISTNQQANSSEEPVWILYQAYPHIENGQVESIMGCITDISQFKWAESVQARSADAARAAKQRLEDFIDITSHEMRNPLSAVTQCADDILDSIGETRRLLGNDRAILEELHQMADTAKSIALVRFPCHGLEATDEIKCAMHQRRIIDDVLTLSKLDSALLSVVPVLSRPDLIISDAMRMFAAEFASSGIQVDIVDETPDAFGLGESAYCDSTRLMQVMVNLITNAIKFTRAEDIREVVIKHGSTDQPPSESNFGPDFAWSTSSRTRRDLSSDIRYGEGATIYLTFSVRDTGQGLPKKEAVHIFDKFIQANRRTYIKYGGSGLGLFISRELIELQGGKIGVSSETGKGSTFAFYVKAKRGFNGRQSVDSQDGFNVDSPRQKNSSMMADASALPTGSQSVSAAVLDPQSTTTLSASILADSTRARPVSYNILLVEDNLVNQKVLAKQLRKTGFVVVIANHGGEAVDRLLHIAGRDLEYNTTQVLGSHPIPFDCILMDWEMPVLDGLSATRQIRKLEQNGVIRPRQMIIGVTANARAEQIQLAQDAGMDEIVVKPFRVRDLVKRVAEATGKL